MGMFVHGDRDEKAFYDQQEAMQTLGINGSDLAAHRTNPITPPTHKDVLLERWAKDTREMAKGTIARYYDDAYGRFDLPDGYSSCDPDAAFEHYIAYLNSAAEVGK